MRCNLILKSDSYKFSHFLQFPEKMTNSYYYLESRGGEWKDTVFFGLQYLLQEYLSNPITQQDIDEAEVFLKGHGLPFCKSGWEYIFSKHGGKLPLRIKAVAEGTVVPSHNVLMTVESTDSEVAWLAGWAETLLLKIWYSITIATLSRECKKVINAHLEQTMTTGVTEALAFKLHDFGYRGVSSEESAGVGGMAHLVNFMGSDTIEGVRYANHYYSAGMAGFSIPAAEHSTITSYGRDGELEAYDNMLNQFAKPGALLAVVSDSYDLDNAVKNLWGKKLKQKVIDSGAMVVIRPDSGDPATMVLRTLKGLDESFGSVKNSKGFKVLNNVRVIQGDGINLNSIREILSVVVAAGYCASNVAFGMGGALLQQVNRDTLKFAYKCSSITVDGKERDVFKAPADEPFKRSKAGRFSLFRNHRGEYFTVNFKHPTDQLETVFENGVITKTYTFAEIRQRAALKEEE